MNETYLKTFDIKIGIKGYEFYDSTIEYWSDLGIWCLPKSISKWMANELELIKRTMNKFVKEGYFKQISEDHYLNNAFLIKLSFVIAESENIVNSLFFANGWKGRLGLEIAKLRLKEFHNSTGELPNQRYFELISNKIINKQKYWKDFGVKTWNDLLIKIFGKVNKSYNEYKGKKGLDKTLSHLREFKINYNRIPKFRDKEVIVFVNCISRGVWKDFGFKKWNDLLLMAFNKVNKESNLYIGNTGLKNAINELQLFYQK